MATYQYELTETDGSGVYARVRYNISPDLSVSLGPGDQFTISGQAYCRDYTIRSIECRAVHDGAGIVLGSVVKTISKGAYGTFTLTGTIPEDIGHIDPSGGRGFNGVVEFGLLDSSESGYFVGGHWDGDQFFTLIRTRLNPVPGMPVYADNYLNALGYFGNYVQDKSLPRLTLSATLDPLDPKLTIAQYALTLKSGTTTVYTGSNSTGIFNSGPINVSGTIDWAYTVTDSAGKSASATGSFTVLPYAPPIISTLRVERYKTIVGDQGQITYVAADDGEKVRFTISADVAAVAGKNGWTLKITYGRMDGVGGTTTVTPLSGANGSAETIRKIEDRTLLTAAIPAANDYQFTVKVADYFTEVPKTDYAYKAGGYFNVEKHGVAVGMRSTATEASPKFECAYPAHFYDGIYGADGKRLDEPQGIQHGIEATKNVAAGGSATYTVTFPRAYDDIPTVIPIMYCTAALLATLRLGSVSATGFSAVVLSDSTSAKNIGIHWVALGTFAQ